MFSKRTDWTLNLNRFSEAERRCRASGSPILDLTVSNPTRAGFSFSPGILDPLRDSSALDYDPQPKGLLSARHAVADYYRDRHRSIIDPEAIVLTASTSEGYSYVLKLLCNPGDEILIPTPSYPLFEFLADLHDVKLIPYQLIYDHGWQIDFHSLPALLTERARAVIAVHPNNPTGSFITASDRENLNRFCAARNLALIIDEVFLDYSLNQTPYATFVGNQPALTFTLSGLSKISALPQMKLAWIVASGSCGPLATAMNRLEIIADTFLSVSAPIQVAAAELLGLRKNIQPQLMDRVRLNLSELDRQLARQKACQRLIVEGGWYAVIRIPVTRSDEEVAIEILQKTSVLVHPGHFYDFANDGYLILSLITPADDFREGINRVLAFFNEI